MGTVMYGQQHSHFTHGTSTLYMDIFCFSFSLNTLKQQKNVSD